MLEKNRRVLHMIDGVSFRRTQEIMELTDDNAMPSASTPGDGFPPIWERPERSL